MTTLIDSIRSPLIEGFGKEMKEGYCKNFGTLKIEYARLIEHIGKFALLSLSQTDALYHNMDHTMMVAYVGQEIIKGKSLKDKSVSPEDWLHFMVALFFHDIGYLRGICSIDQGPVLATGINGNTVKLPTENTDAILTPYHVDRSMMFVREHFIKSLMIDYHFINELIDMTRFPVPVKSKYLEINSLGSLVRAADIIGQLADPQYLKKLPALFYEFEELGMNLNNGYKSPGAMRAHVVDNFWNKINYLLEPAIQLLNLTPKGKMYLDVLFRNINM